jgi:hypothetical protein
MLTTLELMSNEIEGKAAQHLADALAKNTVILILSSSLPYTNIHFFIQSLTTLNLSSNLIGGKEAQYLADALVKNTVMLISTSSLSYIHSYFSHRHSPH